MRQPASTYLIIPELSEDLIASEPWSIEHYADGLMDELFADIDKILNVSIKMPSRTVKQGSRTANRAKEETTAREFLSNSEQPYTPVSHDYETLEKITARQIIIPNVLNQPVQNGSPWRNQPASTFVVDTPTVQSVRNIRYQTGRIVGKLVIWGTTICVAIAGVIYVINSGALVLLASKLNQPTIYVPQQQLQLHQKVDAEADLVNYMLGALAIIDNQEATNKQQLANPETTPDSPTSNPTALAFGGNPPTSNLPPLPANITPTSNSSGNVVERIYVPVYQPPSPMRYAPPRISGIATPLPSLPTNLPASPPSVVQTALKEVRPASKPVSSNMFAAAVRSEIKPVEVRNAPIGLRQTPSLLPALPVVPLRPASPTPAETPATAPAATQQPASLPTSTPDAPSNTLEGLLELGNKSAALFKINGVTRRVNVGETIGASGWVLIDVNNGEAILRRNGEVRSVYAGQKL